jgi:flagellar assembly protein FliH
MERKMSWSSDFPILPEPTFVAAPDVWQLADLSYITEVVAAQGAEPEQEAVLARAATEAYDRGYEEGRLAGERAERARLRSAFDAANDALCTLTANQSEWAAAFEDNVCALATAIARNLMERELRADPMLLRALVKRATIEFGVAEPVRVRVNPTDLSALSIAADMHGVAEPLGHWTPDATIAPGGCVVEGQERIVDGRVDTALERLYRRVTQYDL